MLLYDHAMPLGPGAFFPRTPLTYALSTDDGETWEPPVIIDDEGVAERNRQHIYPSCCCTDEGILVIYSTHAADPAGSFSNGGAEGWKIGGGKYCLFEYPD
jgi:hypothetical protein